MASAADLSGKVVRFTYGSSPTEVEIISGSFSDQCDVTHYQPVGSNFKRTVAHGRLGTLNVLGAILTTAYPFTALAPGTSLTTVALEPDRGSGSSEWAAADAVVAEMTHEFDSSTHQIFRMVLHTDGTFSVPT